MDRSPGGSYGESSKPRIQAEGVASTTIQERVYHAATVVEWIKAEAHGENKLAELFERRMLPEFRPAFQAWKKTDPLHNPDAPAGPEMMKEFHSSKTEQAANLNKRASEVFEEGNMAREHSDDYVRVTVMLATVLLLTAVSQRFKFQAVRIGLALFAAALLCFPLYRILMLPRA